MSGGTVRSGNGSEQFVHAGTAVWTHRKPRGVLASGETDFLNEGST